MAFPPVPTYPDAIDNDRTLFLVFNTTETTLAKDNEPWTQEIEIVPVDSIENEIWADNGFANLEGELIYYDAVEKNSNGVVYKLKKCVRGLGGTKSKFNKKGTWIRSFVIAEHHNQLATAIINTENFIGRNFDERQETLDWRIRNFVDLAIIEDDYDCPMVNFYFEIVEDDNATGKLANYNIEIEGEGSVEFFKLDFGDGTYTTTELSGTHRYAANATVDPVLVIGNEKCQSIFTPIERDQPQEPEEQIDEVFDIPVPESPEIPDFTYVPVEIQDPDLNIPPQVFPCLSLDGENIDIPDLIGNIFSNILIQGPDFPVNLPHSVVTIIGTDIPSVILIDPPIPPTIVIDPPIPPTIVLVPGPAPSLTLDPTSVPKIEVDWGAPPDMQVELAMAQEVAPPEKFEVDEEIIKEFGEEFADLFTESKKVKVNYKPVGIPEKIEIVPPSPDSLKVKHDFPKEINVNTKDVNIPSEIKIFGPDAPIPDTISFDASNIPNKIDLVYQGGDIPIKVETDINVNINEEDMPSIKVDIPKEIPSEIIMKYEGPESIAVNMPDAINLEIPENFEIPVKFPDEMPQIEMVYKGEPIEVKITLDDIINRNVDGSQCVMIVPCPTK